MKTKILLPENIFSRILLHEADLNKNFIHEFQPASIISKLVSQSDNYIGLIPTLDLLSFKELFISSEIGISFNALLSNSYIHFKEGHNSIEELYLKGDVTSNEIILSKILFKEFYDVDIKQVLVKAESEYKNENTLIVGDENFNKELFLNGLSFSEEIIELLDAPYVNFVLAGRDDKLLKNFCDEHLEKLSKGHKDNLSELLRDFNQTSIDFINVNIQDVVFDFEDQDLEGIKTLLQLPYYHGIVKDMIDIKFI